MINKLAYTYFLGLPVVGWTGILTIVFLFTAAGIALLSRRGIINRAYFVYHSKLGITTVIIALIHMILALSAYLNY